MDAKRIGARLREMREKLGLSQKHVGAALSCHPTNVSLIESGQVSVSVAQLIAFARLLGRAPGGLITELLHEVSLTRYGHVLKPVKRAATEAA